MSSVSWYFFMSPCMLSLHLFLGRPPFLLPETSSRSDFARCGWVLASSSGQTTLVFSPCHLVPSSRIRPLATTVVAPLHPALSLASRLMLLTVAPIAYPLRVSTHICLVLPLFLVPFILPSITSSHIPPALTTCPK